MGIHGPSHRWEDVVLVLLIMTVALIVASSFTNEAS